MTKVRWPFEAIKQIANHPEADSQEQQLADLISGKSVIIPASIEHARAMLRVAQIYIKDDQDRMMAELKR